jgi:hypothetical protein
LGEKERLKKKKASNPKKRRELDRPRRCRLYALATVKVDLKIYLPETPFP